MAVFLGNSPDHATSVPLVLSLSSGLVSPQYRMVFDDSFTTVKSFDTDKIPTNWPDLFKSSEVNLLDPDQEASHKLDSSWHDPSTEPSITSSFTCPQRPFSTVRFIDELEERISTTTILDQLDNASPSISSDNDNDNELVSTTPDENQEVNPPSTQASILRTGTIQANIAALESTLDNETNIFSLSTLSALLAEQEAIHSHNDGTTNLPFKPYAFAAAGKDTLHYGQLRKDPDCDKFEVDMQREVKDLLDTNSVKIIERSSMPKSSQK